MLELQEQTLKNSPLTLLLNQVTRIENDLMSFFSDLIEDSKVLQKRIEKDKLADPMWQSFLSNPTRFQVRVLWDIYSKFGVKSLRC